MRIACFEVEKPNGLTIFVAQASSKASKASNSQFVVNSSRWFHEIFKVPMMPKMFMVLALLAHGAVSVRSGTWLSKGQLEPEKGEENLVDEEKLIDYLQKRVKEVLGVSATRHQAEDFLRTVWAKKPEMKRWEEKDWTKLSSSQFRFWAMFHLSLDVGASAVAFCGELLKAVGVFGIERELRDDSEEICSQVLTGNLSKMSSAPGWAVKAAEVAEMDGHQHPYGRLDGVAWKHSLKRVCHDECEELVQGIRDKAEELEDSAEYGKETLEDACAAHVVRHVEAEILGCCSKSCGWNGQFCSFFPFLNSTEQADWQAECCSERNILTGSSRQHLCDSTLSQVDKIKSQNLTDQRPNEAKDRDILGQDESDASNSVSLIERSGGSVNQNTCPPPINLDKIHKELREKEWKRMNFGLVEMGRGCGLNAESHNHQEVHARPSCSRRLQTMKTKKTGNTFVATPVA